MYYIESLEDMCRFCGARETIRLAIGYVIHAAYVTGFERTRLPRTQQEDTLFTITR